MPNILSIITLDQTDTLTQSYADKWKGASETAGQSGFISFMNSNDLIFVVLGVSLIIWFVLLFFLIRIDKKITKLENEIEN